MLKGNLSSFNLGEIFQSLSVNNHTGTLRIITRDGDQKCIYFSQGEISLFSSGSPEPLRIGEILIRLKKLTRADLTASLGEQKTTGELLGKVLLRKGLITKDDLRVALECKIREEVYDLFLLTEAEFEFHINHLPEEAFDPLLKNTRIAINTSAVVLEGIRRVDEWRLIQRRIKTFDEIFLPSPGVTDEGYAGELLQRLDGATPVWRLFGAFGGSRFECCKTLYEFLDFGKVRPLTIEEAVLEGGKALEKGNVQKAFAFFRFADQLDPARVEVLRPLGDCLEKLERNEEAFQVRLRALHLYDSCGMHEAALELGQQLIAPGMEVEPETADIVFRAAVALGRHETVVSAGGLTARLALAGKDFNKAEEVQDTLWTLGLKDLNFRIELAELYSKEGQKDRAIGHLEAVADELQAEKRIKELIKVLRLILEIEPRRQDIKFRTQNLILQQERIEKRKKRRITIAGAAVILLLGISTIPLFYELKARELYSHAQRLEEISLVSNDFTKVKAAYEQLLRLYCFSSRAGQARAALDRVAALERVKRDTQDAEKAEMEKAQERKLQLLRESFPGVLAEAKRFEDAGRIQEAHAVYTRLVSEFGDIPGARNILFPILVTSSPRGARVELNGVPQGVTPLVIHASKGQEINLVLSRSGCQTSQEKAVGGQGWRLHFNLGRRPIGELRVSGPIHQGMDAWGGKIFFPSRDGILYSVIPSKREAVWQRRVGQYGDLVSEMGSAPEEIILGTVTGELLAISRDTGKARWKGKLEGAILAPPVLSPDGQWVAAASLDGEVSVFDYASGEKKGTFRAEDEVVAAPAFAGDILIVGSADHRLYDLTLPKLTLRKALELSAPVTAGLTPYRRSVVLATGDGEVHCYSSDAGKLMWSTRLGAEASGPPVIDSDRAYLGTASGLIVALNAGSGAIVWRLEVAKARVGRLLVAGGRLYAGTEAGDVVCVNLETGAREWAYKAEFPIFGPPLAAGGLLFIPGATGKILVMEISE